MKQSCHILSGNVYTICQENYRFADNYSFVLFNCILQRTALENPLVESAKNIPPFNILFRKRERHRLRPVALNFWSRRKEKLHGRKVAANKIEGRGSERLWTFLCVLRETDRERERNEGLGVIEKSISLGAEIPSSIVYFCVHRGGNTIDDYDQKWWFECRRSIISLRYAGRQLCKTWAAGPIRS